MASPELDHLLSVLKDRDIEIGRDNVAWAYESPQTRDSILKWTREYLSPLCLLTKEELAFANTNDVKFDSAQFGSQPVSDVELEILITKLDASTMAIAKQNQLLEEQGAALRQIRERNAHKTDFQALQHDRQAKMKRERGQIELGIGEISFDLQSRLQTSLKKAESSVAGLSDHIEKLFEKDDRLLDGLDKISQTLSTSTSDVSDYDQVQRFCDAMAAMSIAEIRSRLDYTCATYGCSRSQRGLHSPTAQSEAIGEELEDLCREIDGLASMAVENEYRKPLLQALDAAKTDTEAERTMWLSYSNNTLQYLISRIEMIEEHARQSHAYHGALKAAATAFDGLTTPDNADGSKSASAKSKNSERNQKGLRPLRLVQANFSESNEPSSQILRLLDLNGAETHSDEKLAKVLSAAIRERQKALDQRSTASGHALQLLAKQSAEIEDLQHAVYTHSLHGDTRLVDHDLSVRIKRLDEDIEELSKSIGAVDIETMSMTFRKIRDALLQRPSKDVTRTRA